MKVPLKIMVLNAQDLFLFMDKYDQTSLEELTEIKWQLMSSSLFNNKSKEKCQILAQAILDAQADIVMMTEVGGHESLANFAHFVLNQQYLSYSLPSNSDRGIDLGYLVRRDLAFSVRLKSHADYPLPGSKLKFSRDVLRLDLLQGTELRSILLLVHIKSKFNLRGKDFEGRTQRLLEVQGLVEIYNKLKPLGVPILVGGDFNGHAGEKDTEEEFLPLYQQTDLKDIAYLAQIPPQERFSYVYFNSGGNRFLQQIDYLFISENFASLIKPDECYFPRYKSLRGTPMPIPMGMEHRHSRPSDHYPFVATVTL
jgi:endonuclease/exonuclease/phosphatase family metal-dependent hydrolase